VPSDTTSLFVEHRRSLIEYAAGIVGSRTAAEDVVQEAYLRFAEASKWRLLEEPLGYLYRIVRNLALDGRRRQAWEGRHLPAVTDAEIGTVAAPHPSPETEAADRSELLVVLEALGELPVRTRLALEMHRFDGLKLREIAERLGISVTLAHSLVAQAVKHCHERLRTRS
jgi:RNA polymerase sigma factor (sigma-70 family)